MQLIKFAVVMLGAFSSAATALAIADTAKVEERTQAKVKYPKYDPIEERTQAKVKYPKYDPIEERHDGEEKI